MASKYWIKLYHEILEDPKMGILSDNLWRRVIELFLLAGELDCNGTLPGTLQIAWKLRLPVETVSNELEQLAATGIIAKTESGWIVTNFEKRQAASEPKERVKQFRERKKRQERNQTETKSETNTNEECNADVTKSYTRKQIQIQNQNIPKGSADAPAAVNMYRSKANTYPNKTLWQAIEQAIGDDPVNLTFWGEVVFNYIACGWNKGNIKSMLEFYGRREIPAVEKPERNKINGHSRQYSGPLSGTGERLNREPTFDPYTGETILPDV